MTSGDFNTHHRPSSQHNRSLAAILHYNRATLYRDTILLVDR